MKVIGNQDNIFIIYSVNFRISNIKVRVNKGYDP